MSLLSDVATTYTNTTSDTLTADKLREIIDSLPPDPVVELMMKHGCNPDDGWRMMVPGGLLEHRYVIPSNTIVGPILVNTKALGGMFYEHAWNMF